MICAKCERQMDEYEVIPADEGTDYEGKYLCEDCFYECDTIATFHCEGHELYITEASNGPAEWGLGIWQIKWHPIDGWRGYYKVTPPEEWKSVGSDAALWGLNEGTLSKFHDYLEAHLAVPFVMVTSRTSNVFSTGVDWFVKVETVEELLDAALTVARAMVTAGYNASGEFPENVNAQQLFKREVHMEEDIVELVAEILENVVGVRR